MTREDVLQEFGWDNTETYSELSADLADEVLFLRKQLSDPDPIDQASIDRYEYNKSQWIRPEKMNSYENTMMLKPFLDDVEQYQKEVLCTTNGIASHNIQSTVYIKITDPKTGEVSFANVKWIEPSMMMGCGCWSGIIISAELDN